MHPSFEQLVSVRREGPVDVAVQRHVEGCARCRDLLESMDRRRQQLIDLPAVDPDTGAWAHIQKRIKSGKDSSKPMMLVAAASAGIAMLVTSFVLVGQFGGDPGSSSSQSSVQATAPMVPANSTPNIARTYVDGQTRLLMNRAQKLETLVARLSTFPAGTSSASTQEAMWAIRDQLVVLDYGINNARIDARNGTLSQGQLRELWQQRVTALESMVTVQQAELASQGFHATAVVPVADFTNNSDGNLRW